MYHSSRHSKIWVRSARLASANLSLCGDRHCLWRWPRFKRSIVFGDRRWKRREWADFTQCKHYLHIVHYNSAVKVHEKSMRTELSNSRYNRYVFASGNIVLNFNSTLILPFSGWDYNPPTRPYQFWDRRVTWNSRLYTRSVRNVSDLWPGKWNWLTWSVGHLITLKVVPLGLHTLLPAVPPLLEACRKSLFRNGV